MNKLHGKISASMMCTNPFYTRETFDELVACNVEYLHLDIMDGKFVPNLGIGLDYVNALRSKTDIAFDYHCMVTNPDELLRLFNVRAKDMISIHYESSLQIMRTIENAKKLFSKVFIAINPGTPISSLEEIIYFVDGVNLLMVNPGFAGQTMVPFGMQKAEKLRSFLEEKGLTHLEIEVDGNITCEHAGTLRGIGADIFVAGTSSIFGPTGIRSGSIQKFRTAIS